MTGNIEFLRPPIVELVLGAQFSPLTKLTTGHFGLFWQELGQDWTEPRDGLLLEDQFELFDQPKWRVPIGLQLQIKPTQLPNRFILGHRSQDRLLQLQATRFHLNWKKRESFYPSYHKLIDEFETVFARFTTFAQRIGLGPIALNQWELTYIDAFPRDEYWKTPADWSTFLPGLFGTLFTTEGLSMTLEHRAAEWSYELSPSKGRLHISAGPGRAGEDNRDALLLQMTARGPIGHEGAETLRAGLELGHRVAVEAFLRATSTEVKQRWEPKS